RPDSRTPSHGGERQKREEERPEGAPARVSFQARRSDATTYPKSTNRARGFDSAARRGHRLWKAALAEAPTLFFVESACMSVRWIPRRVYSALLFRVLDLPS